MGGGGGDYRRAKNLPNIHPTVVIESAKTPFLKMAVNVAVAIKAKQPRGENVHMNHGCAARESRFPITQTPLQRLLSLHRALPAICSLRLSLHRALPAICSPAARRDEKSTTSPKPKKTKKKTKKKKGTASPRRSDFTQPQSKQTSESPLRAERPTSAPDSLR